MIKKQIITIAAFLIGLSLYGQSYKIDIFDDQNNVQLDIWTYGAWQPTDSTHIGATIFKIDSIYTFKVNSIKSNQILLWSETEIKKSIFPFQVTKNNNIEKIIESDRYGQMMSDLKKDIKNKMKMTDEDLEKMGGYQYFFYLPGVMYEAYHQPYIEILKHFISKEIKNEKVKIWVPNFSDSIPAMMITTCRMEKENLITNHILEQDSIVVCNYLYDKEIKEYEKQGGDTAWYARTFNRDKCPYMDTDYEFESELVKDGNLYRPQRISYKRRSPTSVRIEIELK